MKSFTVIALGNVANEPEVTTKNERARVRFHLLGDDYVGRDESGTAKQSTTSVTFVAFGVIAEAIGRHVRKGDQLIIQGYITANNWTDGEGQKRYDHNFIVDSFRFGAPGRISREELAHRDESETE
jgi:single-strand DNA-binding protein